MVNAFTCKQNSQNACQQCWGKPVGTAEQDALLSKIMIYTCAQLGPPLTYVLERIFKLSVLLIHFIYMGVPTKYVHKCSALCFVSSKNTNFATHVQHVRKWYRTCIPHGTLDTPLQQPDLSYYVCLVLQTRTLSSRACFAYGSHSCLSYTGINRPLFSRCCGITSQLAFDRSVSWF